jgi:hypothetical protein
MLGKSPVEYILIRAAILGFRLVAPTSLLYIASSFSQGKFLISNWLGPFALAEAAFYLLVYLPRHYRLQKVSVVPILILP